MPRIGFIASLLFAGVIACGGGDDDDDDDDDDIIDPGPLDGACAADELVGTFEASLRDGFTAVQGKVVDNVTPFQIPEVVDTDGNCRLLRPPTLFCDPACGAGFTCDADSVCIPVAEGVSVGALSIDGMKNPVEIDAPGPPVYFYTNTGTLDHPGFDEGDEIVLVAEGEGDVAAFALGGRGVAPLVLDSTSVPLETDMTTAGAWTLPGQDAVSEINAVLNIAQHGGTPGWIECDVPDSGQLQVPQSLTNQLLAFGFSGFPTMVVTRRTADSTTTSVGCIEFLVESAQVFDVEIPGLTSCSDNDDCDPPETCQPDLSCG